MIENTSNDIKPILLSTLQRLSQMQRSRFDRVELQQVIEDEVKEGLANFSILQNICQALLVHKPKVLKSVDDPSLLPLLIFDNIEKKWGILRTLNSKEQWVSEWFSIEKNTWLEVVIEDFNDYEIFSLKLKKKFDANSSRIFQMVKSELVRHKKWLIDASISGVLINTIAIASAFYSMQIYDRVVPTGAQQTLLVLTTGILFIIGLEFVAKLVDSLIH
jgi:ATP-binding cassette subfamily C protein LapB